MKTNDDLDYGPKFLFRVAFACVALIVISIAWMQLENARKAEILSLDVRVAEVKREGEEKCSDASRNVDSHIGTMYFADPLKFSQTEEDMIEKAKSERPELYNELIQRKAIKTRICNDVAAEIQALENQVAARAGGWF